MKAETLRLSGADLVLCTAVFLSFFAGFLLRSDGGINLDALMYARHALELPEVSDNLCPPAYPLLLRVFEIFSGDYFLAGKMLNGFCLLLLLFFSWKKQFFFRETLFLLSTKAGAGIWSFSFSEIPFLTALYFQFFLIHSFLEQKSGRAEMTAMLIIQGALLMMRHAAVFLFPGMLMMAFLLRRNERSRKNWLVFLLLNAGLTALILGWNYLSFGSFFGENFRGVPEAVSAQEWKEHFFYNLRGLLSLANPFFSLVFQYGETGWFSRMALLADLLFLLAFGRLSLRVLRNGGLFSRALFICGGVYLLLLFFSSFGAGIETLNTRLMAPGLWCLYLPVLTELKRQMKPLVFSGLAMVCLTITLAYVVKTPYWYPSIRSAAKNVLFVNPQVRYFFIDRDSIPPRQYSIPFTKISLTYYHPVLGDAYVNQHALMIVKPELELIDSAAAARIPGHLILLNSRCRLRQKEGLPAAKIR